MVVMTSSAEMDIEMEEDFPSGSTMATEAPEEDENEPVGQLADEAKKRKERLRALKQKLMGAPAKDKEVRKIDAPLPKPMFRSYNPTDEKFQDASVPKAKPIDIETQIADTLEHAVVKPIVEDVDLTSLAPRKPDWDLKRDVAPKLSKLERRTQRAIAELILDRLKNNQQNLAAAAVLSANPRLEDDDDD